MEGGYYGGVAQGNQRKDDKCWRDGYGGGMAEGRVREE